MANETLLEDYDDSLVKCKKISKIIPKVSQDIAKIGEMNQGCGHNGCLCTKCGQDFDLRLAQELFKNIQELKLDASSEKGKRAYVTEFRSSLILGLQNIGDFLSDFDRIELLDTCQRHEYIELASSIVKHQESIVKIAEA